MAALAAGCVGAAAPGAGIAAATRADRHSASKYADPIALYGSLLEFDVYRNGDRVGVHKVRFERSGASVVASGRFKLKVSFLLFTAYRFDYESIARWRHGQLETLEATALDNGDRSSVSAARQGERVRIQGPRGSLEAAAPLYPTSHWNAGVLGETRVLNTLTGRINKVSIEEAGREPVSTERGKVPATRYAYSGELETEVWYDDAGRWVKMRFQARDGSTIEYLCRRYQGHADLRVRND